MAKEKAKHKRRQQAPGPAEVETTTATRPRSLPPVVIVATSIIALHAALLAWSAVRNSVAYDEFAHLPAGVAYLRHGELSIYNQTPPLLRWLGAWPAAIGGAVVPDTARAMSFPLIARYWVYGEDFLAANADAYHRWFVLGRLALIPLSCFGAWVAYRFARELYDNELAGVAACALYALCPNLCAHASLVGTDAGSAVAMLAATWLWWRLCRQPTWRRAGLAAIAIALAHLCKFYAVLLWPMALLMAAWYAVTPSPRAWREKLPRMLTALLGCGVVTLVVVNVAYGFGGTFRPLSSYTFGGTTLQAVQHILSGATPIPLPANFVEGYDAAQAEVQTLFPGYLFGETYRGARWNYYPVALLCKLPLATLILLFAAGVSGIVTVARRTHANANATWRDEVPILIALITFLAGFVLAAKINIGIRYLLPAFPLAFVLAARLWRWKPTRFAGWGLLVVLLCENLASAPRYLSFYNIAAGRGYPIVNDFDWGQSLIDLRDWMRDNRIPTVHLAYHGRVDPGVYGIDYVALTEQPRAPLPYVAISGYYLTGNGRPMMTHDGLSPFIAIGFNHELMKRQPVAVLGSILVYERGDLEAAQIEWQRRGGGT